MYDGTLQAGVLLLYYHSISLILTEVNNTEYIVFVDTSFINQNVISYTRSVYIIIIQDTLLYQYAHVNNQHGSYQ